MRNLRVASVVFAALCGLVQADLDFGDPKSVPLSSVKCTALNRAAGLMKEIELKYVDVNPQAGRTLLLVHGWPALWHIWRPQIEAFKNEYRIIAVNQRGFGGSENPGDLQTSSTMGDFVGDLTCILEHARIPKALCIGHDWGSQVCNEAARMRPDVFEGVVGTTIPYIPYSGPHVSVSNLVPMLPKLAYNVFFSQHTNRAVQELNSDVRRTLRATLRTVGSPPPDDFLKQTDSFLRGWDSVETIPPIPFLTAEEEEYWVDQFSTYGFNYTLGFYVSGHASWAFAQAQGNHTIPQPALSILPIDDPVANWVEAAQLMKSGDHFLHLTTKTVEAAHWLNNEKTDEVNAMLKGWLDEHYPATADSGKEDLKHPKDEL